MTASIEGLLLVVRSLHFDDVSKTRLGSTTVLPAAGARD